MIMSHLDRERVSKIIEAALREDIGAGDITSEAVIDKNTLIDAVIIAREDGVICGMPIAEQVFSIVDPDVRFRPVLEDGARVSAEKEIAFIQGNARSILRGERVAINFLSHLSGVSTETEMLVSAVKDTNVKIYDTRKTLPLYRYLDKYAVKTGGGYNHRMGLWDMALIKDNHLRVYAMQEKKKNHEEIADDIIKRAKRELQKNIRIELEVESIKECELALLEKPDIIMLDNMPPEIIKKAVLLRERMGLDGKVLFEVSGGVTIANIHSYALTGIEIISSGAITSSAKALDFSLEIIIK
ncbi:nicotinate-nucleotide pyrophosphorylase [Candidatus Omnitrophus magneticus]|uniref:Probable nicotinate-nucleotide pyrophosphorylase [carboxylating] n=1 Tax=Candidatus Omnitrophus magneticus TaxID=1609969 RepID=A0A0F0CIU4_9BACT|nr:nicotinate-nucleotide pyrophosphorylase [Candidatus Omnitrophus magneticus]